MRTLSRCTVFLLVFGSSILYAQDNPTKITIYSADSKAQEYKDTAKAVPPRYDNCIKLNFPMLLRGAMTLLYERRVAGPFTVEVGVGPTFSQDHLFVIFPSEDDQSIKQWNSGHRHFGYLAEISPRFYISKKPVMQGWYAALHAGFRRYNFSYTTGQVYDLKYDFTDLAIKGGYQLGSAYDDQFIFDIFAGVMRTTFTGYFVDQNTSGSGSTYFINSRSGLVIRPTFGGKFTYAF